MKLSALLPHRRLIPLCLILTSSWAAAAPEPRTIDFSALGIAGSFEVIVDSETQEILDVTSVWLTIDKHRYKIKDLDFGYNNSSGVEYVFIGGQKNGGDQVLAGTRDFSLIWNPAVPGGYFTYSRPGEKITTGDFAQVEITP